jgi:hypothetical protein
MNQATAKWGVNIEKLQFIFIIRFSTAELLGFKIKIKIRFEIKGASGFASDHLENLKYINSRN